MLTIFSIPKPFAGHIDIIQRNAIASWTRLPGCEVMLCGDDAGTAEVAREFGARHIAPLRVTELGTPQLDSAFSLVAAASTKPVLCYVNCDVILLPDLVEAIARIQHRRNFLVAGQRWDVWIRERLSFDDSAWEARLRERVRAEGALHPPGGSDYFAFPKKSVVGKLPPFAVGRPAWDNWLLHHARALRVPVIDATEAVFAVHQNHDYSHVKNGDGTYWNSEGHRNLELAGGRSGQLTLNETTHRMRADGTLVERAAYAQRALVWRVADFVMGPALRTRERWRATTS